MESPILRDINKSERRANFRFQIGLNPLDDFVHLLIDFDGERINIPVSPADAQSIAIHLVNSALSVEGRKTAVKAS
jgi:hypothetical protein